MAYTAQVGAIVLDFGVDYNFKVMDDDLIFNS